MVLVFVFKYFITCSQDLTEGKMTYTDFSSTDVNFNNFTSLGDYKSTMNFFVATTA